jgi:hypothetical protein
VEVKVAMNVEDLEQILDKECPQVQETLLQQVHFHLKETLVEKVMMLV